MAYEQLREKCFFKTGRDGVVVEYLDEVYPNLFDNNAHIGNGIFKKYSQFKVTLVDARKTNGKGNALYYNISPEEALLLTYILSDGNADQFMKRAGAFNALKPIEQVGVRNIVATFDTMNFARFDALIKKSDTSKGTSITLQKNFNINGDTLLVRKFTLSYEEAMNSTSKWKITIETGTATKDAKGNGLNVVVPGSFKSTGKSFLMLLAEEVVIPVNEASKRVMAAQTTFYPLMKAAEVDFTKRKLEAKDYNGDRIDEWNPQGKSSFEAKEDVEGEDSKTETKSETKPEAKPEVKQDIKPAPAPENKDQAPASSCTCSDCNADINEQTKTYSVRFYKKPLCYNCQKKNTKVS